MKKKPETEGLGEQPESRFNGKTFRLWILTLKNGRKQRTWKETRREIVGADIKSIRAGTEKDIVV